MKNCEHGIDQINCNDDKCVEDLWGPEPTTPKVNAGYGDDEITGYPDHYILNGDPSSCGCPQHRHLAEEQDVRAKEAARAASEPHKEGL